MPRSPAVLRLFAAATLLAAIGLVGSSCVDGLGLTGYENGYTKLCGLVQRCYGDTYSGCATRLGAAVARDADGLLDRLGSGCLEGCNQLHNCLDFESFCSPWKTGGATVACGVNEDCCGFSAGTVACQDQVCCSPIGTTCAVDEDCCPNTGYCVLVDPSNEQGEKTCGGVVCGLTGDACLNDFQCCAGRCGDDGFCEETPCPPEGFACETDADCCKLACVPTSDGKRCGHPSCAQSGEPCKTGADCCASVPVCNLGKPGADSGICSTGECNPDNSDCGGDGECCSQYCHPTYHLCGECAPAGAPCAGAITCCDGLDKCGPDGTCAMP